MKLHSFINKSLKFIHLQLFITLMSLPIFLAWGIPISIMSGGATLLFTPLLTAFLLLSSLIFFSELLFLPNGLLIWFLELVTNIWLYMISFESKSWMIGFTKPPLWFLIGLPLLTIGILLNKKIKTQKQSVFCLVFLLVVTIGYLKWLQTPTTLITTIACNKGEITLIRAHNKTIVVDPGVIGQRLSAPSWVQYTLIPEIIKQTGATTIDHLIILKPGVIILEALASLCSATQVTTIYYPYWSGDMSAGEKRNWAVLYTTLKENETQLKRIGNKKLYVDNMITIESLQQTLKTSNKKFNAIKVDANINQQSVTIETACNKSKKS